MKPEELKIFSAAYAATLQGLCANPTTRLDWTEIRSRATIEGKMAVYAYREACKS